MTVEQLVEKYFDAIPGDLHMSAIFVLAVGYFHHDPRHDAMTTWQLFWHYSWDVLLVWGVFACIRAVGLLLAARYFPRYLKRRTS